MCREARVRRFSTNPGCPSVVGETVRLRRRRCRVRPDLATTEGLALYGGAAVRGLTVGAEPAVVLRILLSLMITMTVYTVLGVGVGTVLRNQTATLTVLGGYLYMVEHSLAIIPRLPTDLPRSYPERDCFSHRLHVTESSRRRTGNHGHSPTATP